jgi:hypothetical protein
MQELYADAAEKAIKRTRPFLETIKNHEDGGGVL